MTPNPIAITLYRSLLRVVRPFISPTTGPILCSLIYRTGEDDHIDYTKYHSTSPLAEQQQEQQQPKNNPHGSIQSSFQSNQTGDHSDRLSSALNNIRLSKEEARDLTRSYDELRQLQYKNRIKFQTYEEGKLDTGGIGTRNQEFPINEDQPSHVILYKQLLRRILGEEAHMIFPSQITSNPENNVMTRLKNVIRKEFRQGTTVDDNNSTSLELSGRYCDVVRRDTAFLTLRELEKKLVWAESLGLTSTKSESEKKKELDELEKVSIQAAKQFKSLPYHLPSHYLRPGSFLVAHPFLTGFFSRTVICILDHSEASSSAGRQDDSTIPPGGTYGIIINRKLTTSLPSGNQRRNLTLREVIRHDCLPEGIKTAFGDSVVRDGGPVNLSIQMLRSSTAEDEEKLRIGGQVLPMILNNDCINGESDNSNDSIVELPMSPAQNTGSAVFFGGDIIKAAQSVIDNEMEHDHFSFVIGASVWEVEQLESEIARGYWLPCRGPPQATLTGMCDNSAEDVCDEKDLGRRKKDNRPNSDLWFSMMCALGDAEKELAYAMSKEEDCDKNSEYGLACDDF